MQRALHKRLFIIKQRYVTSFFSVAFQSLGYFVCVCGDIFGESSPLAKSQLGEVELEPHASIHSNSFRKQQNDCNRRKEDRCLSRICKKTSNENFFFKDIARAIIVYKRIEHGD